MKSLQLREEYQLEPAKFALENNKVVLGLAPNSGKTEIAIDVMDMFLEQNLNSRILVLAHSTNVLKSNFIERLNGFKLPFSYSSDLKSKVQVHVTIPQNHKSITGKYDFVIVDEAHENYFEKQVQGILKKVSPTKQLLLTGTPSKFIKKGGFKIYTLALNQIPEQYQAKLNIDLVATNYKWSTQLNNDLEVKRDYKFTLEDTKDALESIILKLIERVRLGFSPKEFNVPNITTKIKGWALTYKKLGKTIFICNNIKQSEDVCKVLIKNNVNAVVSNSKTDTDSEEITRFKNCDFDVLVVVNRARLGYSDDNLYNIIDMSGSHNPNIINQMFSRVLRGLPTQQKYYLKVTTQEYGMMDFTHACVCAALMLTDNKYLSTFNGDNFNGIQIPVKKKQKVVKDNQSGGGKNGSKKQTKRYEFPEFTNDVIDFFKNVICNLDNPTSIYKTTTIKEVKGILLGYKPRSFYNDEELIQDALKYSTPIEWRKKSYTMYMLAYGRKILDKCTDHMDRGRVPKGYWNRDTILQNALKYELFKDWVKNSSGAVAAAKKLKLLAEVTNHMKKRAFFNKKIGEVNELKVEILNECKKHSSFNEWNFHSPEMVIQAHRLNMLDECLTLFN